MRSRSDSPPNPGLGGHLPGKKVTSEIARIRGFQEGKDIISPSHFKNIRNREDLKEPGGLAERDVWRQGLLALNWRPETSRLTLRLLFMRNRILSQ